jgi:hypothetical protein
VAGSEHQKDHVADHGVQASVSAPGLDLILVRNIPYMSISVNLYAIQIETFSAVS